MAEQDVPLRDYVEKLIDTLSEEHRREHAAMNAALDRRVNAIDAARERLEQISSTHATHTELDSRVNPLSDRLRLVETMVASSSGTSRGAGQTVAWAIAALGVVATIASLVALITEHG